jgi:hypothetical protein
MIVALADQALHGLVELAKVLLHEPQRRAGRAFCGGNRGSAGRGVGFWALRPAESGRPRPRAADRTGASGSASGSSAADRPGRCATSRKIGSRWRLLKALEQRVDRVLFQIVRRIDDHGPAADPAWGGSPAGAGWRGSRRSGSSACGDRAGHHRASWPRPCSRADARAAGCRDAGLRQAGAYPVRRPVRQRRRGRTGPCPTPCGPARIQAWCIRSEPSALRHSRQASSWPAKAFASAVMRATPKRASAAMIRIVNAPQPRHRRRSGRSAAVLPRQAGQRTPRRAHDRLRIAPADPVGRIAIARRGAGGGNVRAAPRSAG